MSGNVKESVLSADQYEYFATWYTPVVRELVCIHDFKDDYKLLAETLKPPIRPGEAKAAITLLLRLKLIERQDCGGYRQPSTALVADASIASLAVRAFTRTMLDLSKDALDTIDKKERHVSGLTMGVSAEAFDVIAAEIEAFKDRVKVIVNRDIGSSRIYQLNVSMFPVSEDVRSLMDTKGEQL
jgi:uncharacterized protein (TIGR02147 family)